MHRINAIAAHLVVDECGDARLVMSNATGANEGPIPSNVTALPLPPIAELPEGWFARRTNAPNANGDEANAGGKPGKHRKLFPHVSANACRFEKARWLLYV